MEEAGLAVGGGLAMGVYGGGASNFVAGCSFLDVAVSFGLVGGGYCCSSLPFNLFKALIQLLQGEGGREGGGERVREREKHANNINMCPCSAEHALQHPAKHAITHGKNIIHLTVTTMYLSTGDVMNIIATMISCQCL